MGKKCKKSSIRFAKFAFKRYHITVESKLWDTIWEEFEKDQNKFTVLEFAIKNSTGPFGQSDTSDTILKADPIKGFHLGSQKYNERAMLERPETYSIRKIFYKDKIYTIASLVHCKGLEAMIVEFVYEQKTESLIIKTNSKNLYLHEL